MCIRDRSYITALLLVAGFYILAYRITGRKAAAVLAVIFFFINGGFGFAYFLDGAKTCLLYTSRCV